VKAKKCPDCGSPTGHLETTYSHSTTNGQGRLVKIGEGYCSIFCAERAGAEWRKKNVPPPVKTAVKLSVKDQQHGGKVHRLGDK
jgi:hypothetical protein